MILHRVHMESGGASKHGSLVFCSSQVWKTAGMQGEHCFNQYQMVLTWIVNITQTKPLLSFTAPVSQPACAAHPCCRYWNPPSAATRGHSQQYLRLRLNKTGNQNSECRKHRYCSTYCIWSGVPLLVAKCAGLLHGRYAGTLRRCGLCGLKIKWSII